MIFVGWCDMLGFVVVLVWVSAFLGFVICGVWGLIWGLGLFDDGAVCLFYLLWVSRVGWFDFG